MPVGLVVIPLKVGIVEGHAASDAGEARPAAASNCRHRSCLVDTLVEVVLAVAAVVVDT